MLLIPINSVKSFKEKASDISNNRILPICDYIRIQYSAGKCVMTKTNNKAFVMESFDADGKGDQEYMIPEKDIFSFAAHSFDDFLTIKRKDGKVLLSDSSSSAPCLSTTEPFPVLEIPEEEVLIITEGLAKAIKIASTMLITKEDMPTWRSFVFIGNNRIIGCDGFVAFSIPCEVEDKIILGKELIAAIPKDGAIYKKNKSYDFLESGRCLYGFVRSEQAFFDMTGSIKEPSETLFEFNRPELLSFNEWVMDMALKAEFSEAEFNFKEGFLQLIGKETYSEKSVERKVKTTGGWPFKYIPSQMNRILKSTDEETLICYKGENNICITNESKSFISLLQKIV